MPGEPRPPGIEARHPAARRLAVTIGQHSDRGRKAANQDFHGALIPDEPLLSLKGIAVAIADGISSSEVGAVASESAVKSVLTDYYATAPSWSVKTSAHRVIAAANAWLHAQTRQGRHPQDRGYVCTLSVLVLKSRTAHIFHVGDARIYRIAGRSLEQLTEDHRVAGPEASYLGRALGVNPEVEIDYRAVTVEAGDLLLLATDGVHEHVGARTLAELADGAADLDAAARRIVEAAKQGGSPDNLTVQLVRIDGLPDGEGGELVRQAAELPCPPLLDPGMVLDGYRVVRELHASSRSHIYLAVDSDGTRVALKVPSIDGRGDPAYLQRFLLEDWAARRIRSPHVLKPHASPRPRTCLYVATEFIEGQTLAQWMIDNPKPGLEAVRGLVEQIARGLQAFHRKEMLHQDLRPDNVMIDATGTATIIDFGALRIAGIADDLRDDPEEILGTAQYTAPEYFLGEGGSTRSDLFSLGVIAYQLLSGGLPYGADAARVRTRSQRTALRYRSLLDDDSAIPAWVDAAVRKAVDPDPRRRYGELSEFLFDLRHPNQALVDAAPRPLGARDPVLLWQLVSAGLFVLVLILLLLLQAGR